MSFENLKAAKEIYILCPGGIQTGGPELLHQLVALLQSMGRKTYIVYYPLKQNWQTPEAYLRYECKQAYQVPDQEDIAIIVPETLPSFLDSFNKALCVIWWLSVDNYRGNLDTLKYTKIWLKKSLIHGFKFRPQILHLFQSDYARDFVSKRFNAVGEMLSDYLATEYLESAHTDQNNRKNMIVYNPLKGARFTKKLQLAMPDVKWQALEKMTRLQVRETLETAKVYIDFGTHPGKDRIPREAAMCGCVIIVGLRGAACFSQDVPIAEEYKYPVESEKIEIIAKKIRDIFANYTLHYNNQESYRNNIKAEPNFFKQQVEKIFF